jgi:DNA polymerase III subunit epsilon
MELINETNNVDQVFLKLRRPVIFFDLETTGTNIATDRIVELFAYKIHPDGSRAELHHVLNPTIPIAPGATAVHGFTDEMVADKPTFSDVCDDLFTFFSGSDLGGFNIKRFDIPLLMEEFNRVKKYPIKCGEVHVIDTMAIFHAKEKRDLSSAVQFYCDREHADAHSAKSDVLATVDVLKSQLNKYQDLLPEVVSLNDFSGNGKTVDFSGKFVRDDVGEIFFNFGTHQGKNVKSEMSYIEWMLSKDFPVDTRMVCTRIIKNFQWEGEITTWLKTNKILENPSTVESLLKTLETKTGNFPFDMRKDGESWIVSYLVEPASNLTLYHNDCQSILRRILLQGGS